jgi:phosphatidate cytidylyltransferase
MGALRAMTPQQHTALLFVILFGVLMLVSAATVLWSLREHGERARERLMRFRRDLRAVWIGAALFWLAWISGTVGATLLAAVVSFLALREFITLTHTTRADHRALLLAFFVVLPLQYLIVGLKRYDVFAVFIPVYVFLERTTKIQWGIAVCVYGLSHAPALLLLDFPRAPDRGAFLVFFLVVVVGAAQIVQEAASRWFRRRPVARQISRSFSTRAWLVGVLTGGLLGAALYWTTPFKAGQALAMALIAAASGTLGEFVMQALKADAGVRYWGNRSSVTGAVGLLDRVAPLCFAAPVFFHSVRWYFRAGA